MHPFEQKRKVPPEVRGRCVWGASEHPVGIRLCTEQDVLDVKSGRLPENAGRMTGPFGGFALCFLLSSGDAENELNALRKRLGARDAHPRG